MKLPKTIIYPTFLVYLALTACQTTPPPPPSPQPAGGPWEFMPNRCQVQAANSEIKLTTNGKVINNSIELRLRLAMPTVKPPTALLALQATHLPVEGTDRLYTIQLPYTAHQAADLLKAAEELQINFQPLNQSTVWQQSFPTRELLFALAKLSPNCP